MGPAVPPASHLATDGGKRESSAPPPRAARFGAQLAAKTAEQAHGGLGATSRTRGDQPQPRSSRVVCVREHYPAASEFISFSFFCSWEPSQPVPMEPKSKLQIQELCCPTPPSQAPTELSPLPGPPDNVPASSSSLLRLQLSNRAGADATPSPELAGS